METWDKIVEDHGPGIYRLARRILGSGADAEDVVQEAFLEVYLVMRSEEVVTLDGEEGLIRGTVMEDVIQSPQGDWYPTVVRWLNCNVRMNGEPIDGDAGDDVIHYYYDFDAEMPDSLFESDGEYQLGPRKVEPDSDPSDLS